MLTFTHRNQGYTLRLEGELTGQDLRMFAIQLANELAVPEAPFVLLIDARRFRHFTADAQAIFEDCLETLREAGVARIAVLAFSTAFATLFCEMMLRAELMGAYMYIDASYEEDWESELANWLRLEDVA